MAEELDAVGVISLLDARALELMVEAYTEYRHHCDTLEIEGYSRPDRPARAIKKPARCGQINPLVL